MKSKRVDINGRMLYVTYSISYLRGNRINPPETELDIDYIEDKETGYDVTQELQDNQELQEKLLEDSI
ncbi:MAG: hypothetical protein WC974_08475 [Thermoplasmata archaeon]